MDLLIAIGFNAAIALTLNSLILFCLGFSLKLFQVRCTHFKTYFFSIITSTLFSYITVVVFFQRYCLRIRCETVDFLIGLFMVTVIVMIIAYIGILSIRLGYGKEEVIKK